MPDGAVVAAMSREEKLAFAKRLKEERKALCVELGIDDEPKKANVADKPAAAAATAVASVTASSASTSTASAQSVPGSTASSAFQIAIKCLGFAVTLNVAPDA